MPSASGTGASTATDDRQWRGHDERVRGNAGAPMPPHGCARGGARRRRCPLAGGTRPPAGARTLIVPACSCAAYGACAVTATSSFDRAARSSVAVLRLSGRAVGFSAGAYDRARIRCVAENAERRGHHLMTHPRRTKRGRPAERGVRRAQPRDPRTDSFADVRAREDARHDPPHERQELSAPSAQQTHPTYDVAAIEVFRRGRI